MFVSLIKIGVLIVAALDTAPAPKPAAPQLWQIEQSIIDQTNAERARNGVAPLAVDASLEQTARNHAAWMTNNRVMQHSTMNVAENIAWNQRSVPEVMNSWMNSPGHRANILNPSYHRIGVAAYTATDGSVYWCQQFLW